MVGQLCKPRNMVHNFGVKATAPVKPFFSDGQKGHKESLVRLVLRTGLRNYKCGKCSNPTDSNLVTWMHLHARKSRKCSLSLGSYVPRQNLEDFNTKRKKER